MEYRKFDNVIIARIDKGEEILEQLKAIAINENIKLASINAVNEINSLIAQIERNMNALAPMIELNGMKIGRASCRERV